MHEKERIWLAYWSIEGREVIRLRRPSLTIESSLVPSCGGPISPTYEDSTLEWARELTQQLAIVRRAISQYVVGKSGWSSIVKKAYVLEMA